MTKSKAAHARAQNTKAKRRIAGGVATSSSMFPPADAYNRDRMAVVKYSPYQESPKGFPGKGDRHSLPPVLSAYVNPFATSSRGVRYPDAFRGLSGTFSSTLEVTITTSSETYDDPNMVAVTATKGTELFVLTPDPSNMFIQGVCGVKATGPYALMNNTFYWPNGIDFTGAAQSLNAFGPGSGHGQNDVVLPNISAMRNMYSAARLVAGGAKINGVMNFSTVSGTIHMAPVYLNLNRQTTNGQSLTGPLQNPTISEMQNGWQCALPQNLSDMVNLPGYKQYPMSSLQSDQILSVFKRYGDEALLFKSIATAWGMDDNVLDTLYSRYGNSDNPSSHGHYGIAVLITGVNNAAGEPAAASTSILELQITNHYECEFNPASTVMTQAFMSSSGVSTQAPPHQPLQMAAIDNLISSVPAIRHLDDSGQQEATFVKEVANAWNGAVKVATSVGTAVSIGSALLGAFAV